jgi:putative oxidoreductase
MHYFYIMMRQLTAQSNWLQSIALLTARLWLAKIFFMSGLTKIKSWETTLVLFADEYKVPIIPPDFAAYLATSAELILPIFLCLGLLTPLASFALFMMTVVIEIFVYPGTTEHYYWLILFAFLLTHGSGKCGVDYWWLYRLKK